MYCFRRKENDIVYLFKQLYMLCRSNCFLTKRISAFVCEFFGLYIQNNEMRSTGFEFRVMMRVFIV